jgi:fido (protein-threonine AMPylation protein)
MILVEPYYGVAWTEDGQQTRKLIQPGVYKKEPNSVRLQNGEMFHYASPDETPIKMAELMDWFRKVESDKKLHPVQIAAQLHYDFVRIHPFDDSNGRTSRLLMNYVLIRHGFPPVVIKSADKKNYLTALNKADVGDLDSFVEYIAEELVWSLGVYLKAAKGESIEERDDLFKEIDVWKKDLKKRSLTRGIKSKEKVIFISKDSIIKLFQQLYERGSLTFKDLFALNKQYLILDEVSFLLKDKSEIKARIEAKLKEYEEQDEDFIFRNQNLRLALQYEYPKTMPNDKPIVQSTIQVLFDLYHYEFSIDGSKVLTKDYQINGLLPNELDLILSEFIETLFRNIQSTFNNE